MVSNYLYNLIKGNSIRKLRINGKNIEITNKNISIKIIEGEISINDPETNR
jgi:hypothetical protein